MNRMALLFVLFALSISIAGCNKADDPPHKKVNDPPHNEKHFLVDKIYDYHDKLVGDFIYDDNDRLIKCMYRSIYEEQSTDYDFTYSANRVSVIAKTHQNFPGFNNEVHISYNADGQIIRSEIHQPGTIWGGMNYSYDANGRVKSIYSDEGDRKYFPDYKGTSNIVTVKCILKDPDWGTTYEFDRKFTYDTHPKPDFGIGNIFQVEMLPFFGTEATTESYLSKNNMASMVGGTKWIYTYNSDGLPATIETKWKDIEHDVILLKIKYRQVDR